MNTIRLRDEKGKFVINRLRTKNCLHCGEPFQLKYLNSSQKFCSHKCYWNSMKGKLNGQWLKNKPLKALKICPTCERRFMVTGVIRDQIYCSRKCYHNSPRIRKIRSVCRLGSKNSAKNIKTRLKISNSVRQYWINNPKNYGMVGRYHSQETIQLLKNIPHPKGIEHHNWKGGITEEQSQIRNSAKYKQWRNAVLKRDNYTCQNLECKSKNKLIAHHILNFADYPELRFDTDNGLTFCRGCHNKEHKVITN